MKKIFVAALAALCFAGTALAQNVGVVQSGNITAGHAASWAGKGKIQDAGALAAPGGLNGNVQYNNAGAFGGLTDTQLTTHIQAATSSLSGALPAFPGTATTFFGGDGTYKAVPFSSLSGSLACSQVPALTGDATTSAGSCATSVGKVNGVAFAASPATDTAPIITAANVATYTGIPNCPSGALQYTTATHLFSCGSLSGSGVASFNSRTGAVVPVAGDYTVALGGTGTTNLTGLYQGLQPAKLYGMVISVNPGTFASADGASAYTSTASLTTNLSSQIIGNSVATAAINAGGTGGTAGAQVVTASGGTGTAASFNVTISGGAITAVNSIANPGNYSSFPANPVTVTGAGLSGATLNLTQSSTLVGGMLSPGALSVTASTNDGTDVMHYLVKRVSDNALVMVGDNANVYSGSLAAVISGSSNSWSTGGPQTGFWNGTKVRLSCTGYPTGFAAATDYYVVSEASGQNSTTFGLSATYGGAAITAGTASTSCNVLFGVQNHLDAAFGAGVYTVLRRVHFAFRWKWQWGTGNGGIPDFTADPRGDRVYLTYGGSGIFPLTIPSSGTATTATAIDCSPILSNLNRIASFRAAITGTSAGTAYLYAPTAGANSRAIGEGPTAGMSTFYGTADVQTDSTGAINYNVGGGAKLNGLWIEGWTFVDPS